MQIASPPATPEVACPGLGRSWREMQGTYASLDGSGFFTESMELLLKAVFNGALVKAATETTRVARIASFILLYR